MHRREMPESQTGVSFPSHSLPSCCTVLRTHTCCVGMWAPAAESERMMHWIRVEERGTEGAREREETSVCVSLCV